jgi:hypothetical protein
MFDQSHLSYLLFGLFLLIQTSSSHKISDIKNLGAFCANDTALGDPNLNPIDTTEPRLINRVENGTLYKIGSGEDEIWLVHLYGNTGYDFGYAYGTLLRDQIHKMLPRAWAHFEQEIMDALKDLKIPKWLEEIIVNQGLRAGLDVQNDLVKNYMDPEIYAEMRGIADAAQYDYKTIVQLHMLGEITRGKFYI